jgi:hypothetical protein
MAISLLQKIGLAWRGWNRRREQRNAEFLAKQPTWGTPPPPAPPATPGPTATASASSGPDIDREGLQVAYLDDSGSMLHFLDTASGEVLDLPVTSPLCEVTGNDARYRPVPTRTPESEAEDRREFFAILDPGKLRDRLGAALTDATEFRRVLTTERPIERAWYNFKNDRANAAIEQWLRVIGVA